MLSPMHPLRLRFSRRLPWEHPQNRLTRAVAEREAQGLPVIDLTGTNPMRAGIPYPEEELEELLRRGGATAYQPHPRGIPAAREELAAALSREGDVVSPEDLVLTAAPSYPLLDNLAALDALVLTQVYLPPGRRFELDPEAVELALSIRTRLLALVHPGNPTGRFLATKEQEAILALCAARGLPLISDEVFADYPLADAPEESPYAGPAAASEGALAFSLGGLSKSAGLPSWKLGWIRVGGAPELRRRAVAALELVADSYLSVATPVQSALGGVLALAPRIREAIRERALGNLALLRAAVAGLPAVELFEPQGGWAVLLRISLPVADEDLVLELLEHAGVLGHPGYFFDFATDDFLVLSLLPEPERFGEGAKRLAEYLGGG